MKRLLIFILAFVFINFILWGAQELYYMGDKSKIKEIETFLDSEEQSINALKTKIEYEDSMLDQMEKQLDSYKASGMVQTYNNLVSIFNQSLDTYKFDLSMYKTKIDNYNAKVNEVNVLIEKSGKRYYIIPIPIPTKGLRGIAK